MTVYFLTISLHPSPSILLPPSFPPLSLSLTSPAVVVLGITGAVVWLGGSVLGAGNGASACDGQSSSDSGDSGYAPSLNIFLTVC